MKRAFVEKNFRKDSLAMIERCNAIVSTYQAQDLRLTLRQLYYRLVAAAVIPNTEKSYKNLGSLVSDARLAGMLDWDAIEDRVRQPVIPSEFDDPKDLMEAALASYRLPRWQGQPNYVELWVEKDALSGVLRPIARDFHITLMVNRGYSSQSAMFESAKRFRNRGGGKEERHLIYLGDHDPSGEDMVRDVQDRLDLFGARCKVEKLALTRAQVDEYDPPPNPAKMSDSRAEKYVAEHGDSSWEVDALPPEVLQELIRDRLEELLDRDAWNGVIAQEDSDKEKLREAAENIRDED